MIRLSGLVSLSGILFLAGCGGPTLTDESSRTTPIQGLYDYGAGGRDLQLVVQGDAFAVPQATFDHAVESGLAHGGMMQPTPRPRLRPDASARSGYRLVTVFSPGGDSGPNAACAGKSVAGESSPGKVRVLAAFCVGGRPLRSVTGTVSARGIDDPAFADLMALIGASLFQPDELQGGATSF
jgi:hypothetical protein